MTWSCFEMRRRGEGRYALFAICHNGRKIVGNWDGKLRGLQTSTASKQRCPHHIIQLSKAMLASFHAFQSLSLSPRVRGMVVGTCPSLSYQTTDLGLCTCSSPRASPPTPCRPARTTCAPPLSPTSKPTRCNAGGLRTAGAMSPLFMTFHAIRRVTTALVLATRGSLHCGLLCHL